MTATSGAHFVYGTLRPGELAHDQVVRLIARHLPATLAGWQLAVRDGLPMIYRRPGSDVDGDLLIPHLGSETQLAEAVADYEGTSLYTPETLKVRTANGDDRATVYVGRRPESGQPVDLDRTWRSVEDPLFAFGLATVAKIAREHFASSKPMPADMEGFWDVFIPLEGLYLTLCSILERYTALVFGPKMDPTSRVAKLRRDPDAQQAVDETSPPDVRVVDSRSASNPLQAPGPKAFDAWYQVRSNLSHRGKAAFTDFQLIERSLVGLHDALTRLLEIKVNPAAHVDPNRMLLPTYDRFRPRSR